MKKRGREFFGREVEFAQLGDLWKKRVASLVTCRGRRRIGKSTLIEEFATRSGARFIKLEGLTIVVSVKKYAPGSIGSESWFIPRPAKV